MRGLKPFIVRLAVLLLSFSITACQPDPDNLNEKKAQGINAHHYHSFWLWGNVNPAPYLANTTELYLLQGEVSFSNVLQQPTFTAQGMGLTTIKPAKIWLVYRTTTLQWSPELIQAIIRRLDSWQRYGNQVIGLQIDFDSATGQLEQYAKFLQSIRQQLPSQYQLSATGLLDWSNASANTILSLGHVLNEIVIQTYQGTRTINNYRAYLPALGRLNIPFKIGLVQHGQWVADPTIEKNPYFKGYVVFLLKE
ncbi:DUF3142 domain-containing protein [Alkanindiges illinoisensis]|uniref:DUF3142 domain-containing protein n=1 Tax=Alkanindiges illinoisensis TaxID=197183 RepID=UPI000684A7C1|nr:DUF3142 domain-containing protein [Alkanindiges illinoisensis]